MILDASLARLCREKAGIHTAVGLCCQGRWEPRMTNPLKKCCILHTNKEEKRERKKT